MRVSTNLKLGCRGRIHRLGLTGVSGSASRSAVATVAATVLFAIALTSCHTKPVPDGPSIIVFVLDTTRADAVSAYGEVEGTTPTFDRLAAGGLLYTHAYAQAPWTLPSHATLLTGLLPREHGAGLRRWSLPETEETLAERLAERGYETAGFSENHFVSDLTGLDQGFESFQLIDPVGPGDTVVAVHDWLRARKSDRPFFLFVNLMDAHSPYQVRAQNPFVTIDSKGRELRSISQSLAPEPLCNDPRDSREIQALRGLYLGDVRAADARLGAIWKAVRAQTHRPLITIVTADHGEHLGEHGLMGHLFSLRNELLHVPLVVHGLANTPPARIDVPVQLADIFPTVLAWAGVASSRVLPGRPLPTTADSTSTDRFLTAEFADFAGMPDDGSRLASRTRARARSARRRCRPEDHVFGNMRSVLRYPIKLLQFEQAEPSLYDLENDPAESQDLSAEQPELLARLEVDLRALSPSKATTSEPHAQPRPTISADVLERLRALGYAE